MLKIKNNTKDEDLVLKFKNNTDEALVLEYASKDGVTVNHFIKKRNGLLNDLRATMFNFRKSQDAKAQWRRNRHKMLKGIKGWHKSTTGKRFHRKLTRFLKDGRAETLEKNEFLVALSSLKTHLIIEDGFYVVDFDEHLSYYLMSTIAKPIVNEILQKVEFKKDLETEEIDFLKEMCDFV